MNDSSSDRIGALARPDITQLEIDAVVGVLKTPYLSLGPKLLEFEQRFAKRCGARHAVACNSGTSALHMVVRAMNIGPGDEVITTPFSFVASSNCAIFEGAKPVFIDVDPATWCIDGGLIESAVTDRTRAILPVDVFGVVADMPAISRIADRHRLRVIEDSCEALGATLGGKCAGSLGDAGVFGFYPNKQITTGEGGMVVTDDDHIADMIRSLRNQGRGAQPSWLAHERLGFNFRLSDINCALGIAQLERLDQILQKRAEVANWYDQALDGDSRVVRQVTPSGCHKSWFVYVIRLTDEYPPNHRDTILEELRSRGIACGNYFSPIHLQPFYQADYGYQEGDFPVTEALATRTVALPLHAFLTQDDVGEVVAALKSLL